MGELSETRLFNVLRKGEEMKKDKPIDILMVLTVEKVIVRDEDGKTLNINPKTVQTIGKDFIMSDGKALYTDHKPFIKKYKKGFVTKFFSFGENNEEIS